MKIRNVSTVIKAVVFCAGVQPALGQDPERPAHVLDRSAWVTSYDLPSRRFHLERAVIWSDSRTSDEVLGSLGSVREMASRLADGGNPFEIYQNRPFTLATRTLASVGEQIDRRMRIEPALP